MIDEMVAVLKKDQADEVKSPHSTFEPARDRFLNHFFQRGTVLARKSQPRKIERNANDSDHEARFAARDCCLGSFS